MKNYTRGKVYICQVSNELHVFEVTDVSNNCIKYTTLYKCKQATANGSFTIDSVKYNSSTELEDYDDSRSFKSQYPEYFI